MFKKGRWYHIMAQKKTQKDFFMEIIALAQENGRNDIVAFAEDRIEKLGNKGNKKPTKVQVENEAIKDTIVTVLAELDNPTSATAIATDARVNVSNQKVSALLKQLVDAGRVVRTEEKGKAFFSVKAED